MMQKNIQRNWKDLIKPHKKRAKYLNRDASRFAVVEIWPLEKGLGITLGNALRRVLLSSLRGAAVTAVHVEGVRHQFSSIPGVLEDMVQIILNLKTLAVQSQASGPRHVQVSVKGPCVVTAGMIQHPSDIEFLDPEHVICTVGANASFVMSMRIDIGKGSLSVGQDQIDAERPADLPLGWIPLEAYFSPIKMVSYRVENTRVGQKTDFDHLFLTVETNGSIQPEDAVAVAARILVDQFQKFATVEEDTSSIEEVQETGSLPFSPHLLRKVDELELSIRAANCLKKENITYIGDLIIRSEADMMKTPNFGRKSLNEISKVLERMGLNLGMEVKGGWPPADLEDLIQKYPLPPLDNSVTTLLNSDGEAEA